MDSKDPKDLLSQIGGEVREAYARNRRVMSFDEFFQLLAAHPSRHGRSAAQYLKDVFDHFGTEPVKTPRGTVTRWKLFDRGYDGFRGRLVGQEEVQGRFYRVLSNFVREGKVNKLILMHGPNGSAKSTFVSCLVGALENYSSLDEGALYRFNWIFPSQKLTRSGIGFGGEAADAPGGSYAYLDDELIDARLTDELRDHPALLLPQRTRAALLADAPASAYIPSEYILHGDLGHKNKQVFEALLGAYKGDYLKVLRHVQVERFYLSRRYRAGAVTVEPQLAVDARSRQLTMDRSLAALPPALQSLSMYEYSGELVDANRGLIEYSDLLKRPLEAYKYLLGTVEQARVPVDNSILFLDAVFVGSSNESHLAVFKEVPEFQSFKGRLELIRVPYLLDYTVEETIYREQIKPTGVGKHVGPHTAEAAALWAVLTRMRKPLPEKYPKGLAELVAKLTPLDKAELYARGRVPDGFTTEQARDLHAAIERIWGESESSPNYEGRTGASPREIRTLILNAAQNPKYACVTPMAVLDEMDELVKNVSVYEFLKQEPLPGGYYENKKFIQVVRDRLLDWIDDEVRSSMGLVDEKQYAELFTRYVTHVSHWIKKEKVRNAVTARMEEPDEELMAEVERTVGATAGKGSAEEGRRDVIARIGAWSIDHPNQKPDYAQVFPRQFQQLRDAYFELNKKLVKKTALDLLVFLTDGAGSLSSVDKESRERVETTLKNLKERFGYCEKCAREAVSYLSRRRYT
ncbi:MAG: serine protein kinase PrkA [Myxococcales bacterium]|nr:serine protein kinase PrkA [Myxococcales bacterium]